MSAQGVELSHGRRHLQHGPIDIVIGAEGAADAVAAAHQAAWRRFESILDELVAELPALRRPLAASSSGSCPGSCPVSGSVARRMWHACRPYADRFITPMAAVAGAVAQELIASYERPGISRAWVNNGGDIALHLAPGQSARVGLYADLARLDARQLLDGITPDGRFEVTSQMPVRGIATSGWRGRSFSLGIADSVTVLADSAAAADAAATAIANAVAVDDPLIQRRPAKDCKDDSDLGDIPVTVDVPPLPAASIHAALHAGLDRAIELRQAGLIWACVLVCQQRVLSTGGVSLQPLVRSVGQPQQLVAII